MPKTEVVIEPVVLNNKLEQMEGVRVGWAFVPNAQVLDAATNRPFYVVVSVRFHKAFAFLRSRTEALSLARELVGLLPESSGDENAFVKDLGVLKSWLKVCNKAEKYTPYEEWAQKYLN